MVNSGIVKNDLLKVSIIKTCTNFVTCKGEVLKTFENVVYQNSLIFIMNVQEDEKLEFQVVKSLSKNACSKES